MLVAEHLARHYGPAVVVHDASFQVLPGQIVGLVGANGAGKTTTIKMVSGILAPTHGRAALDGEPTEKPATRNRIGYLPEDSPLYDDMTPIAYLQFFGSLHELSRAESKMRGGLLLQRFGLAERDWTKPIGTLSKGMRRKVAIARCVLHQPKLLVLDEPTSGLDPFTTAEVEGFLAELRAHGKAILLSAHNLKQVETLCDNILVMDQGRLVAHGTLDDLRRIVGGSRYLIRASLPFDGSRPDGPQHVGTVPSFPEVESTLARIKKAGGTVLAVESLTPSLDEVLRRVAGSGHG